MQAVWAKGLYEEKNINVTYQYRLTPTADTVLILAASNLYRLFINGTFVGYGPARAAHGYSRTDKYTLSAWANKETVISVEVHSARINTYYIVDEAPFFAAEIMDGETLTATAADFTAYPMTERVQKVRRFSFQRGFSEVYRLTGDPSAFFAGNTVGRCSVATEPVPMNKLLPRYVSYPTLETVTPREYVEYGTVSLDPNGEPWRDRAYENIDDFELKGFLPAELEVDPGDEEAQFVLTAVADGKTDILQPMTYQTYDFGRTLTGFFRLQVQAKSDVTLYILFDEVITPGEKCREVDPYRNACLNIIKYSMPAGDYTLLNFEANSARFAQIVVTEGTADVSDFGMVLYENPDVSSFTFDYGDSELNSIVSAAVNTFAQNAVDVLTDCPSRERAGWLCDSYFSSRAEVHFTGKNVVEKSFLENYTLSPQLPKLPEGMIPMCYPGDHNKCSYIPNWSMWYILEMLNYWKRTGDEEMRALAKDKIYGLIKFFSQFYNEFGLLEDLQGWVFIEWSKCNTFVKGVNFPSNMLWAAALDAAAELYDDPALTEKACAMRQTIRQLSWNGEFFEDNALRNEYGDLYKTGNTTETCQYYAFFFGTATIEEYPELFETMLHKFGPTRDAKTVYPQVHRSNAFIGNYLRLEILLRHGYTEQVLQNCRDFFLNMATLTGTLWEHAQLSASLNHGFASMAAVYIDECMKQKASEK